jgi:hypothetical protein
MAGQAIIPEKWGEEQLLDWIDGHDIRRTRGHAECPKKNGCNSMFAHLLEA